MTKEYRQISWVSPKLTVGGSAIQGVGVIATEPIAENETIVIWGGVVLSLEEVRGGSGMPHTQVAISETHCLATSADAEPTIDDYMNHSCDPNVWMLDEVTLVASRAVKIGEELTADYAIWLNDSNYKMKRTCSCGSTACRKIITGEDWKLPTVISRNYPHFSPFLNIRIAKRKLAT